MSARTLFVYCTAVDWSGVEGQQVQSGPAQLDKTPSFILSSVITEMKYFIETFYRNINFYKTHFLCVNKICWQNSLALNIPDPSEFLQISKQQLGELREPPGGGQGGPVSAGQTQQQSQIAGGDLTDSVTSSQLWYRVNSALVLVVMLAQ